MSQVAILHRIVTLLFIIPTEKLAIQVAILNNDLISYFSKLQPSWLTCSAT